MYGVVTRNAEELDWPEFETGFYEVKDVTGRHVDPVENAVSMVSCFGDNATAGTDPELVPVDDDGRPATRERQYFDWAYICPLAEDYRNGVLTVVETCSDVSGDVRLDDVGFPRAEYCHCDRCTAAFEASAFDDWQAWRADVITSFVADAVDRIDGKTYLTLYPDPYPGHLYERAGLDLDALAELVDEFVVPLYDTAYETTYWIETIAAGFEDAVDAPFSIELYAVNVDIENLLHAAEVAAEYGEDVFFGYEASNARAALRRLDAEDRDGVSFGPE
ncbi:MULTISPECIES: hypothetical protein [Halobacterium]|uniref:Glycoside hydrolase domain protein n=4 Tax=Halobacterium salinarum TaxID=2242 RepID=Q9HQ77_HALSA|nr:MULTISPECIES: hypothetical protein [Halobacterium]AAG19639.1 hypothetical protein VNG_1291H [Halobacterium salinarum NRC-1]MBB6090329.1 hypothetical protein [Halobacterium salinarum]MCF2165148.1 hypothetical protein [Halobacterium salinarum]MCF2168043.1 hypothetical protein [Halobacterium salinarum]MCF2239709.1 hypothetical protein [Halobacterium salinarum]